jgi:hypothetical protein
MEKSPTPKSSNLPIIIVGVIGVVALIAYFLPNFFRSQVLKGKDAIEKVETNTVEANWELHWDDAISKLEKKVEAAKKREVQYLVEQKSIQNSLVSLDKKVKDVDALIQRYVLSLKKMRDASSIKISVDGKTYDENTLRNQLKQFLLKKKEVEGKVDSESKVKTKFDEIVSQAIAGRVALQNKVQDLMNRKKELESKEDLISTNESLKELEKLASGDFQDANSPEAKVLADIEKMIERKSIESEVAINSNQEASTISVEQALRNQVDSNLDNELESELKALIGN